MKIHGSDLQVQGSELVEGVKPCRLHCRYFGEILWFDVRLRGKIQRCDWSENAFYYYFMYTV